jgi:D-glycero-alpha-D-manno-heptose-7-phosphate kinase
MGATVARAPLRVALGGGGTDLPSYYSEHGGFVVSTAIDRYVHMLVSPEFQHRFRLKHLEWEEVDDPADVRHPILREALIRHWDGRPLELASVADAPPGTGLGSSGAYAVCAVAALRAAAGLESEPALLAEAASAIEIDGLGRTVGKQDQYVAAFGGVRAYTFNPDGSVEQHELTLPQETLRCMRDELLLFFTGRERSTSEVLARQVSATASGDEKVRRALDRIKELAQETCAALESGDLTRFAELMHEQWEAKRDRAPGTVTDEMERLREELLRAGARGVTSIGAGGGGFLLVLAPDAPAVRTAMERAGVRELRFGLEPRGCAVL